MSSSRPPLPISRRRLLAALPSILQTPSSGTGEQGIRLLLWPRQGGGRPAAPAGRLTCGILLGFVFSGREDWGGSGGTLRGGMNMGRRSRLPEQRKLGQGSLVHAACRSRLLGDGEEDTAGRISFNACVLGTPWQGGVAWRRPASQSSGTWGR